ncbi:hypothetical protein LQV63_21875 [Paenibacillus profundus]|uniref:Uncharacterized protein n=1 Tax=Paenibacillus profundus TaxID=1173085 RepID=A0ABS8YJ50_9BACL|nr:hypothetical protein [Paenibacillus profundus]MCE5171933.1 hypothetical protein [Paenibacillus profundus]
MTAIPPPVSAQAEAVRKLFLQHGFTGIQCSEQVVFVLGLVNEQLDKDRASHMFTVPAAKLANGDLRIDTVNAGFSGLHPVPSFLKHKAANILQALCSKLASELGIACHEAAAATESPADTLNTMAPNEQAVKQLGEDMNRVQTKTQ